MNFLDQIWLIPLFPLFGAALMLLVGKLLDPQPASEVAVAPAWSRSPMNTGTARGPSRAGTRTARSTATPTLP